MKPPQKNVVNRATNHAESELHLRASVPGCLRAFTLIELTVVLALLTLITSTALLQLGGVTDRARLRAASVQVASVVQQAHALARSDGRPRLITYDLGLAQINMQSPQRRDGRWDWDDGLRTTLPKGVRIHAVLRDENVVPPEAVAAKQVAVRVDAVGAPPHAVILARGEATAVVTCGVDGSSTLVFPEKRPQATTLAALRAELAP